MELPTSKDIIIFGAAKFAQLAYYLAAHDLNRTILAFVVDADHKSDSKFLGLPVVKWSEATEIFAVDEVDMFVAVGHKNMRRRAEVYRRISNHGYRMCNLISPSSYVASNVSIGDNTIIMPGAVIEPHVVLGCNNMMWSNATICHDTVIGDHNFIAANVTIGGHVTMGNTNFIGASTTIEQHIRIGNETLVGGQSLLREATHDLHQYWGVPAKNQGEINRNKGIEID